MSNIGQHQAAESQRAEIEAAIRSRFAGRDLSSREAIRELAAFLRAEFPSAVESFERAAAALDKYPTVVVQAEGDRLTAELPAALIASLFGDA